MFKRSFFLACFFFLACVHQTAPTVTIENDQPLSFSGKGAGAGFMLSSAIGSVGMAIGIAIDEGIKKDIAKTAERGNVDIIKLLRQQWHTNSKSLATIPSPIIRVDDFGFITWPGEGDLVAPKLHITLTYDADYKVVVKFPEDFNRNIIHTAELERVKKDAGVIQDLLLSASAAVVNKLIQDIGG